jgi:two-component system, LytTR family, sensor kinase
MVALARKKSDRLEPMLINLSGLMRYMLYETDESKVPLQREAQYLQSYIDLQSMRYDNVKIGTDIEVPEDEEYMIEPMLLIPFVENAFKHGIDNIEQPEISIVMKIVNGVLLFRVENKMGPIGTRVRDDARGIGLVNTRKRLNLLYGRKYTMNIEINDRHVVVLKIHLI